MVNKKKSPKITRLLQTGTVLLTLFIIPSNLIASQKTEPNMVKIGLTDIPEESLSLEYAIKEKAYLQLLEKDLLPYLRQKNTKSPTCFISYAWGDRYHEFWVKRFSEMLEKAGFNVLLDRWEDRRGKYLTNFIEKIENADWVIVVGTPLYLEKYNKRAKDIHHRQHVVRLEAQLINYLISFNEQKSDKIIPVLLEGKSEVSFPFLLRPKLAADFTKNDYFEELLKLIRDLYNIDNRDEHFETIIEKFSRYSLTAITNISEEEKKDYIKKKAEKIKEYDKEVTEKVNRFKKEAFEKASFPEFSETKKILAKTRLFNLPPLNSLFSGREQALIKLKQKFNQQGIEIITQTISGMAGVGKTQLATEFAYKTAKNEEYSAIFWIPAETTNSINYAYTEFANALKINIKGFEPNKIQPLVHNALIKEYNGSKILFVLDNVPSHDDIQNYIWRLKKQISTNFVLHILITSRNQYWPEDSLILDIFTSDDALSFVKKWLPTEKEQDIIKLNESLHYFPLALSQATAYIKSHTSIEDYLLMYTGKKKEYLNKFYGDKNQYRETLWSTLNMSLGNLRDKAADILFIASYLYPDDIPIAFFDNLSLEELADTIENLRSSSLITLTNNNKSFKIHRMLQEVIRISLEYNANNSNEKNNFHNKKYYFLKKAIKLLKRKFDFKYTQYDGWNSCGQYALHAQTLADNAININNELIYVSGIQLYAQLAMYLMYAPQDNENAKKIFEKILTLIEHRYNSDPSHLFVIANIKTHLGFIAQEMGYIKQAEKFLEQVSQIYETNIFHKSLSMEKILTNLRWGRNLSGLDGLMADQTFALYVFGVHKQDLGDLKNTELSFKKALVLIEKCKNKDSVMVYKYGTLGSLIELYRYYGYTEQATIIANEAQRIENDKYLSPIDRVFVNERIASLKYYLGMYDEAQKILERSLKIRYTILSQNHYKIGCTKTFLGLVLSTSGDVTNAISTLEEAEKILEKNFERDHIYYIFLYLNMSYAYEMQKRYDMALKYIEKAQQAVRKHFGDGPYEILLNYFSPIEKLPTLVNSMSSHNYYVKSFDIIKMLFGENHIWTARYNYLLGQSFENIKNKDKAIEHYINALSIARKQTFNNEVLIKGHHKNIQIIQRSLQSLIVKASICSGPALNRTN